MVPGSSDSWQSGGTVGPSASGAVRGGPMNLGGLFADGIPKLRPSVTSAVPGNFDNLMLISVNNKYSQHIESIDQNMIANLCLTVCY